ncbi:MAG: Zn-ribbon domain-containing OB-fold protein [Clostridia bacterium]|nr:Zn-ribbon domain-containing OB-fold protein [Clostridia bacterium]
MAYEKPLPSIDPETEPFWQGTRQGRLLFQECRACGQRQFYPRGFCTACGRDDLAWVESRGRGTVASFTVVHQAFDPSFSADVPYTVALVDLDEGVRMMSNIVGCDPAQVHIGMRVEVVFEPVTEDVTLYKFRPAAQG